MPNALNGVEKQIARSRRHGQVDDRGGDAVVKRSPACNTIWVDLENSPNVPFFKPIIEELESRGYSVLLTARDCFQVCGLAELLQLKCKPIGHHYGKNRIMKLVGLAVRTLQLLPAVIRVRPIIAVSHGSRSQLLASKLLGIPTLQIADYEFTKAWLLIRPSWVMVPAVIPDGAIKSDRRRILRYPGIKEDVYVPSFTPDAGIREELGIEESEILVTMRPPANEAHYHRPESDELFRAAVDYLSRFPSIRIVMLPRNDGQAEAIRARWPQLCSCRTLVIADHVVDGLNLIWHSDLVVSGGGTMNREAAALNVPVYSVFRGEIGAVDRYLASIGRLVLLQSADKLQTTLRVCRRPRPASPVADQRWTLDTITNQIAGLIEALRKGTLYEQT